MTESPTPIDLMIGEVSLAIKLALKDDINQNAVDSLMASWESIKQLARTGYAVNKLAPGAGIIRSRETTDENTWGLVEIASPLEPEAPPLYFCGSASSALEAAQIHRTSL